MDFLTETDVIDDLLDNGRLRNQREKIVSKSVARFVEALEATMNAIGKRFKFETHDAAIIARMLKQFDPKLATMAAEPAVLGYIVQREVRNKSHSVPTPETTQTAVSEVLSAYRSVEPETTVNAYDVIRYTYVYALLNSHAVSLNY